MVTAPLNKEAVTLSGRPFTGHTEYIAELCGATESRMLLMSERLSTIHVTTHVALRQACESTSARVLRTIELGNDAMKLLGFAEPRIAVCGLNPHAGEHGLFGDEDARVVAPAVEAARNAGIRCTGPVAPDTVFLQAVRGAYDLVVAMYHDQGHIPMKLIDFEGTVNISLGIPIIRTSVDHGTAFDIAGRNRADARSMKQAMRVAARMAATKMAGRAARVSAGLIPCSFYDQTGISSGGRVGGGGGQRGGRRCRQERDSRTAAHPTAQQRRQPAAAQQRFSEAAGGCTDARRRRTHRASFRATSRPEGRFCWCWRAIPA